MKYFILIIVWICSYSLQAESLIVSTRGLSENAVLIGLNRHLIPSVLYRIQGKKIIFTGSERDIDFLKSSLDQGTLMPFFRDAYQELIPVNYTVTFQIKDPYLLLKLSGELSCALPALRQSQCGSLHFYSASYCKLNTELKRKIEQTVNITSSLDDAKLLKVMTDNPCVNPRWEKLYDFALKALVIKMSIEDFNGPVDMDFSSYLVSERELVLL